MTKGDLRGLMRKAEQLQAEVAAAERRLAEARVEATSGGGVVKAVVNGHGELVSLQISPEVVQPDGAEFLSDLLVAAVREAQRRARELAQQALAPFLPPGGSR